MTHVERLPYSGLLREKLDGWGVNAVGVDFDGTLIDTPELFKQAMEEASNILSSSSQELGPDEIMSLMGQVMDELRPEFGVWPSVMDAAVLTVAQVLLLDRDDSLVERSLERVHKIYTDDTPLLFAGARELIDRLNETGRPVHLMTHADPIWTRRKLTATGLLGKFASVVCFSIDHPKAPQWSTILDKLNIDPEKLLVVGDNIEADILPPVGLGARAVYVDLKRSYYSAESTTGSDSWQAATKTGRVHTVNGTEKVVAVLLDAK